MVWGQHTYIDVSDHDGDMELCEEDEGEKGVVVRGKITKRKNSSSQERGFGELEFCLCVKNLNFIF